MKLHFLLVSGIVMSLFNVAHADSPNLAARSAGAVAWSNGFIEDIHHGGPFRDNRATDGIEYWYDDLGKPTGSGWMGVDEGKVNEKNPAIWGVNFPKKTKVNRVKLHYPRIGLQLVDFQIEYKIPGSKNYKPVAAWDDQWSNPVVGNPAAVNDFSFQTVETTGLRVVITRAAPEFADRPGSQGGTAYISEFQAYYEPDEQRQAMKDRKAGWISAISRGARAWLETHQAELAIRSLHRPAERIDTRTNPTVRWALAEKIRTTHTPFAASKLIQYADDFRAMGLNSHMVANWHFDARTHLIEPDLRTLNAMANDKDFHLFLWTAWYWYPENADFPDRHAFRDLSDEYRGAVDFMGTVLFPTPCPLADEFWASMNRQAIQAAKWSLQSDFNRICGFVYDFEHYGAPNGRSYDSYNHDKCFCDDCFGTFLKTVGCDARASDIPAGERYRLLKQAGAREAYYELLAERTRQRAKELRQSVDQVNPDFLLGFYGAWPAFGVFETSLDDMPNRRFFASWFGQALLEELGTPRAPMVYAPLVTDPAWNPFYLKRDALQAYLESNRLPVLFCPGYIIIPEQSSAFMAKALSESLQDHDGFWMNELWMYWSYKENPNKPLPSWYPAGATAEPFDRYWDATQSAVDRWQSAKKGNP